MLDYLPLYLLDMIKSHTLPTFNLLESKKSTFSRSVVRTKSQKRVSQKRMKELKMLLMLSMIKVYKKQYVFRLNYNDLSLARTTFNLEEETFKCFQSLEGKLERLLHNLCPKQKEKNQNETNKSDLTSIKMQKQASSKETVRQLKIRKNRSEMASRYAQEVKQFEKLNTIIDKLENCNIMSKSMEYLNVLKSIMTNLRTIIYKYFKRLKENDGEPGTKTENIKLYCQNIYAIFKEVISIIQSVIDKDDNYEKYAHKFNKLEATVAKKEDIIQHFQMLLFYFNSTSQLARLYEISSKLTRIAQYNPIVINKLIKLIIKLRHMLGYLTKEIINFNIPGKGKENFEVNDKDIWKNIYEKKYQSNAYKKRLRLQ